MLLMLISIVMVVGSPVKQWYTLTTVRFLTIMSTVPPKLGLSFMSYFDGSSMESMSLVKFEKLDRSPCLFCLCRTLAGPSIISLFPRRLGTREKSHQVLNPTIILTCCTDSGQLVVYFRGYDIFPFDVWLGIQHWACSTLYSCLSLTTSLHTCTFSQG